MWTDKSTILSSERIIVNKADNDKLIYNMKTVKSAIKIKFKKDIKNNSRYYFRMNKKVISAEVVLDQRPDFKEDTGP